MKRILLSFILAAVMSTAFAQIPQHLNYQGRVSVNGVNFNGNGQFKFALVDGGTTFGTTAAATATVDENGVVTGVFLDNTGVNYTEPPTITIGGPGIGATATAHLNLGIVSFVTVTNGGSGYTTPPTVTFSAPPTFVSYNHVWNKDGLTLPFSGGASSIAAALSIQNNSTGPAITGNGTLGDGVTGSTGAAGKSGVVGFASLSDNNAVAAINGAGTGLFSLTGELTATAGFFWNTAGGDGTGSHRRKIKVIVADSPNAKP